MRMGRGLAVGGCWLDEEGDEGRGRYENGQRPTKGQATNTHHDSQTCAL